MDKEKLNAERKMLNEALSESDDFFKHFGELDDLYLNGAIPKKYKELSGLAIFVLARCEECVQYHIQGCLKENANKTEIIEAIKMGVIGGGSITYPTARFAMKIMTG